MIWPAHRIGRVLAAAALAALSLAAAGAAQASAASSPAAGRTVVGRALAAVPPGHRQICPGTCLVRAPARAPRAAGPLSAAPGGTPAAVAPPAGSWGFDTNYNGCAGKTTSWLAGAAPQGVTGAPHLAFDAIQLNGFGWATIQGDNPCYQAQAQWYAQNNPGQPVQLIMFPVPYDYAPLPNCGAYASSVADGHSDGWDQAKLIYQNAIDSGLNVHGGMWWLDVEQFTGCDNGWQGSKPQINLAVIQGAVDFLHQQGLTAGIYTDGWDWNNMTGDNTTEFAGIPAWNALPYRTSPFVTVYNNSGQNPYDLPSVLSWAQSACDQPGFTGGPLQAVQYMWGDTPATDAVWYQTDQSPAIIGRDFDYQCRDTPAYQPLEDLFLYNSSSGASYSELADGSGGWNSVKGPAFSGGWTVYPGDYSGDGLTDYFLYNPSTGATYVELADGSGGWNSVKGPAFSAGWTVYPGDYNGDGLTDLFLYNPSTGATWTEFANGSGGWSGAKSAAFSAGWNVYPGDYNGDGLTDLFLYNSSSGATYVELADRSGGWNSVKGPAFSAGWTVYPGNLNGDGLTDLFLYNPSSGASYVELADGSGGWSGAKGAAFSPGWSVYPGDYNGDGLTDLFLYNSSSGASYVELADGSGGWNSVKGPAFSAGWTVYPGNLNGDRQTDLFLDNPSTGATWAEFANGSGGWSGVKGAVFSPGWNVYPGHLH